MQAPYRTGDKAAYFEADLEGIRVHRVDVTDVEQSGGSWYVSTAVGSFEVNEAGEGSVLVPLDEQLERAIAQYGDGYLVPTTQEPSVEERIEIERLLAEMPPLEQGREM